MEKGLVAVSGGVDSTNVLLEYKKQGICADGVIAKFHDMDISAVSDAQNAADKIGSKLFVLDLREEFENTVISEFIDEYENLRTPNPCITCNIKMKFGVLADFAKKEGYDFFATGHYVRIEEENGEYFLKKAKDLKKDQSYVLWGIKKELLPYLRFPMGEVTKDEARENLLKEGLSNAKKKDSQDICFIPNGKYAEFIEGYTGKTFQNGEFVDLDGKVLGEHKGLIRYTIGQRKGLGLALPCPMYVTRLDREKNQVILGLNGDLMSNRLTAKNVNWLSSKVYDGMSVLAKARYAMRESPAVVRFLENNRIEVKFEESQRAITSGQSVVLYDGDTVLGGGIIE
ncbi:MAG: tRNA 2-thiouridine(34) synthase MnmA [Clostridia bacterium]|nr:tRNA 2-thiouridine(34) synthase MnmA [Clostridia bacterium]